MRYLALFLFVLSFNSVASTYIATDESPLSFWGITNKENQMRLSQAKYDSILMFGDSITQGLNQNGLHFEYANLGIAGDTVQGIFRRVKETDDSKYKGIFIEVGTNNLLRAQSAQDLSTEIGGLITYAASAAKFVYVSEIFVPDIKKYTQVDKDFRIVNDSIHSTCNKYENCIVVKIPNGIIGKNGINANMSIDDNVHLNGEAYRKWKVELNKSMAPFPYGIFYRTFK